MKKLIYLLFVCLLTSCATIDRSPGTAYDFTEIEYFLELTTGKQYDSKPSQLSKWDTDIRISTVGDPRPADIAFLEAKISEINTVLGYEKLKLVNQNSNYEIHYIEPSEFSKVIPKMKSNSWVYFNLKKNNDKSYRLAKVVLSNKLLNQTTRDGSILSMLVRTLGLKNTSDRYTNSPFSPYWAKYVTSLSELDRELIRMLYRGDMYSGMNYEEVKSILENSVRE